MRECYRRAAPPESGRPAPYLAGMQRAWLDVDLAALRRNAVRLAAHAGIPLAPVLKADAYGLGAVAVARALETVAPWGYCVATAGEGAALRAAGITRPILVCPPHLAGESAAVRDDGLLPAIGTREAFGDWQAAGGGPWHLSVDTGMQRAGVPWAQLDGWRDLLRAAPPAGVFTHFHSADVADATMAEQEHRFAAALAALPARPPVVHTDNSAAACRRAGGSGSFVRTGVFLYGVATGPTARLAPEPVVSLRARVLELHDVAAGDTVGYGGAWVAPGPRRIATLPVGYADGLRRTMGNGGHVLLRGRRAPITGWVTMDMCMCDVTDAGVEPGDVATVIGADPRVPGGGLDVATVAASAGGSPYELLVGLGLRLPRHYADA